MKKYLGITTNKSNIRDYIHTSTVRHSGGIRLTRYRQEKEHSQRRYNNITKTFFILLYLGLIFLIIYNFHKNR